eukprot:14501136-Alexandrium_andersonii.AAC.1
MAWSRLAGQAEQPLRRLRVGECGIFALQMYPECDLQSAQGPPVLQSASIRSPPSGTCKAASGVRNSNCAGPKMASRLVPKAPKGCAFGALVRADSAPASEL